MKKCNVLLAVILMALFAWPASCPVVAVRTEHFAPRIMLVADRIAAHEGFCVDGTIASRQHNPGGLVYVGQPGARRGEHGYAAFEDDVAGYLALLRDLEYKPRGA